MAGSSPVTQKGKVTQTEAQKGYGTGVGLINNVRSFFGF